MTAPPPRCCSSRTGTATGASCLRGFWTCCAPPLPDAIPAELLDRGDHGDDQTVLLAADEALCAREGFLRGLTELLDRLAAAEALRKLQRERREVMAYLRLAQKALRERQGEDLRSLCCHTREQLDRLQALDAEIAALSAAS